MPHRASYYRAIGNIQLTFSIHSTDRCRDKVVICKCRTSTDKSVTSNHAHLQTSILRDHAVFHNGGHKQGGAKGKECSIPHDRKHQLNILGNIYIIPNNTVLNHGASIDRNIVSDGCRSMNDSMRINNAVPANLD